MSEEEVRAQKEVQTPNVPEGHPVSHEFVSAGIPEQEQIESCSRMLVCAQGVVKSPVHDAGSTACVQEELVAVASQKLLCLALHGKAKELAAAAVSVWQYVLRGFAEENPRFFLSEVYDAAVTAQELYWEEVHVRPLKARG